MTISDANVAPSAVSHRDMANAIRALAMDAVEAAKSGHPGMPMGMADVATVLFTQFLKFDPATPDWPDRDRFVLSAGHGSMLLYALLYLTGHPDIDLEQLRGFRKLGSRTAGHPEYGNAAGIETTTGPLGQGVANAVGMALAERILNARFGDTLVDHHTYALASDGDLMEGISHEAISLAGHLGLGKLIVLFDDNGISIDGPTDLAVSDDQRQRFAAAGWHVLAVDGHDPQAIGQALDEARLSDRPSFIACRTVIGYGAPTKAGTAATHGAALGESEVAGAREQLGWPHPPFAMPDEVLDAWRQAGARGAAALTAWRKRLAQAAPEARRRFEQAITGTLPEGFDAAIAAFKRRISAEGPALATRQSSGDVLSVINPLVAEMIGGSADLTGSNNTRTSELRAIRPGDFSGRYLHYGVREHAMAAAMNGMALHRGVIPYGGTFLIFSDYCRPAIRLSALMGVRVIYVMTHDSIGLGEDGPTHQPVEQLAGLRAMPNLWVFRPAGAVEVAECWQLALSRRDGPSLIALTRQAVPTLRREDAAENLSARGAYELRAAEGGAARVSLLATGSEVAIADAARDLLQAEGVPTRVVSMPCWALFEALPADERRALLGPGTAKVAVEAASPLGWDRYIGSDGTFIGMRGFGESAPYKQLYERFGITKEAVAAAAKALLA